MTIQPFTESEAILIRNFAENMALWTDVTDPARSFELEVPRRALTEPVLRHAVCAFSARHYFRSRKEDGKSIALDYQNKCLELLIPAMSGRERINDNILTAVALLRQNEEMDDHDHRFHLEGVSRILNMVPHFAADGGLGEAAAWLCLRENLYISLTTQSPINIRLESFLESSVIKRNDDFAWANKMVLNLAILLSRVFREPNCPEDLAASELQIAEWNRLKPLSFLPVISKPRSTREGRHFPELWMLAPHHAVGLQYYHIAQIVLGVLRRRVSSRPYERLTENRATERHIRHHLMVVVGLATSNKRAENTWFTARHSLSVWAGCLRQHGDQQAALQFLQEMDQHTGWRNDGLMESLRAQWDEDSDG
ncbi:MAG: hypothetical protein FE78DRAFT_142388 [Acidomyces sp. 'richmondensis']|nr:MAG: hypothetical protein FE78DRAFT_142388 [Acidomyces sp. 'richmondensis']